MGIGIYGEFDNLLLNNDIGVTDMKFIKNMIHCDRYDDKVELKDTSRIAACGRKILPKRPLALIGFTYVIALILLNLMPEKHLIHCAIALFVMFLMCIVLPQIRRHVTFGIAAATCTVAAIISFMNFKTNIEPIQKFFDQNAEISGTVVDIPFKKNARYHYIIKIDEVNATPVKAFKTSITSTEPLECDCYDRFSCDAYFYEPKSTYFFDSKQYFRSNKIYICAVCNEYSATRTYSLNNLPIHYYVLKFRQKMLQVPKSFFDERIANIQNAILLGEKNDLESSVRISFLKNGISHLLATSGVHISIIMTAIMWIFKKIKLNKIFTNISTAGIILIFMALAAFTPSVMRAGIMCIIYLIAESFQKETDSVNSLGIAVFLVCLQNPESSMSIGLWLSALSVLGTVTIAPKINEFIYQKQSRKQKKNFITHVIVNSISVSLSASVFTTPLVIINFKILSFIYPLSNIILIPLTGVIVIFSLLLAFLGTIHFPQVALYPLAFVSGCCVKFLIKLSDFISSFPVSYISLGYPFLNFWLAMSIFIAVIYILVLNPVRAILLSYMSAVVILLFGIFSYQVFYSGLHKISVIECGDGISCIISKNNRRAILAFLGEKPYLYNLETDICCSNPQSLDYFSAIQCGKKSEEFLENVFGAIEPKTCLISKNVDVQAPNAIYFGDFSKSSLWDDSLKIKTKKINNHIYTEIVADKSSFLIIPSGGDVSELPEEWRNIDGLISQGLPMNFEKLDFKNIIIYGSRDTVANCRKKLPINVKMFNLGYYGRLNIIATENDFKVGV